jgi:hypothetical protein
VNGTDFPGDPNVADKVLQRPRNMGVGVCFESATPDARLVERVCALFATLDYRGIFDLEFIVHEGEYLLIDWVRHRGSIERRSASLLYYRRASGGGCAGARGKPK